MNAIKPPTPPVSPQWLTGVFMSQQCLCPWPSLLAFYLPMLRGHIALSAPFRRYKYLGTFWASHPYRNPRYCPPNARYRGTDPVA